MIKSLSLTLFIFCLFSGAFISTFAQDSNSADQQIRSQNAQIQKAKDEQDRQLNRVYEDAGRAPIPIQAPPLVKLTKEQLARLAPDAEDSAKFSTFLKTPKTGLIRLFPDFGCKSKYTVSVAENCRNEIPRSSFYSFRKNNYSISYVSDIRLKDNVFISDGLISNGVMVSLGDVPVENISTASAGMSFLNDYQPAKQSAEVLSKSGGLANGFKDSGYNYSSQAPVIENNTYAIRVIAYPGYFMMPNGKFFYDVLDGDKRIDIIVVFRIVRKNQDGSFTLLWKELERKDSPKLKKAKQ